MSLRATASQTVGPFFELGLGWLYCDDLAGAEPAGEVFRLQGQLFDADGEPIPDAVLEFWHANEDGHYPHPEDPASTRVKRAFRGFGRVATRADGSFGIRSVMPGSVQGQAPHVSVLVFMRGLLKPVASRIYFDGHPANVNDPVLALVPPERRSTLLASPKGKGSWLWNVRMQGKDETVFFEY
jgi:protocatechuate 3,4-dioxygenase alpha subunit